MKEDKVKKHYFSISKDDAAKVGASIKPTLEQLKAYALANGSTIPDYVTDDHIYVHLILTSEFYNHPWYGLVNYNIDDLNEIRNNHISNSSREDVFLRKGHASYFDDGGAPAFGWYCNYPEVTKVEKIGSVEGLDVHGLFLVGHYNPAGYECVRVKDEFRYISSEIYNNFEEREITKEVVDLIRDRMTNKSNDESIEEGNSGLSGKKFGKVVRAVAMTNHPFFHLPHIQSDSYENVDAAKSSFAYHNDRLYATCNGSTYDVSDIAVKNKDLADTLILAAKSSPVVVNTMSKFSMQKSENLQQTSVSEKVNEISVDVFDKKGETKLNEFEVGPDKGAVETTQTEPERKEPVMNFFSMSLADLRKIDNTTLSDADKAAYSFAVEALENKERLADQAARAEQLKQQFAAQLASREAELSSLREEAARANAMSFSVRVESIKSKGHEAGVPTAVVEFCTTMLNDLDVAARQSKFAFANPATSRNESLDLVDVVEKIFSHFKKEMFAGNSTEASTKPVEVVTPALGAKSQSETGKVDAFANTQKKLAELNIPR